MNALSPHTCGECQRTFDNAAELADPDQHGPGKDGSAYKETKQEKSGLLNGGEAL